MASFAIGERVIIRFGARQGQRAEILDSQSADVYKVRAEDGSILFFGGKSLSRERTETPKSF
ncbi:MAG TPA: hypothetical protein VFA18_11105 [Gemmataceae bacterium]|nr:hypothetical protein [Gemmataceae bacterium]